MYEAMENIRGKVFKNIEESLIDEVMTTPKPGLVDAKDNGAHTDMDKNTFVRSARAIAPYITEMFLCGYHWRKEPESLFPAIQNIGVEAEKAMFQATQGVNTHKGAIFTMGILAAASGYDLAMNCEIFRKREQHVFSILSIAEKMMKVPMNNIFESMKGKAPKTHGEKLFAKYGEKGIRGEAEQGFPIIKDVAFPALQSYMEQYQDSMCTGNLEQDEIQNKININVLLQIMADLSDTCVLSRSDYHGLAWMQKKAKMIYELGGSFTKEGMEAIKQWNEECIRVNISPGGAADILAVTLFLWRITEDEFLKIILDNKKNRE